GLVTTFFSGLISCYSDDTGGEGGIQGTLDVMMGEPDQLPPPSLLRLLTGLVPDSGGWSLPSLVASSVATAMIPVVKAGFREHSTS
ncbi:hypothetical protein, partial [Enterobacter hormaechei]|uniref:hypothetical protein n=1 Tax=Enterobacter hormaechei TaxID=158836 RepID=UPI001F0B0FD8